MADLNPFENPGRTKLALVSHGISLPDGLIDASRWVAQANAIESVVDIRMPTGHFATVSVAMPYSQQSGISLSQVDGEGCARLCWQDEVLDVQLLPVPAFYRQRTRSGARMGSFASLHDNLLVLQPFMGCGFFANKGEACQYCQFDSMLNAAEPPMRDPLELVEVVRAALAEREVDTVYLYNGFAPGDDAGLRRLVPVIELLRRHLGHRQISLETVAPTDVSVLDELYAAGLDVFVCNLEVFDSQRFAEICPGKDRHGGQEAIWTALRHAREVFLSSGVVSNLIIGLEDEASTRQGIDTLLAQGVVPMLQPFRPLPGTPLEHSSVPDLDVMEGLFLYLYAGLKKSGFASHRLRRMGRVLTPMESRVLDGGEASLTERWISTSVGRHVDGWMDGVRRYLRSGSKHGEHVIMDSRPIHVLLASEILPYVALTLIAMLAFFADTATPPAGLSEQGWSSLIVFGLCLVLWVSQLLPLAVTSILGLALLPMLGVLPTTEVFALFGSPAVFFILGAFMLAAGVMQSGLSERLALAAVSRFGTTQQRLLLLMLLLPAATACLMPEHVVAALFLPIVWEIVRSLRLRPGHVYASSLFFAVAWGSIIGGVITLLGGARGPLALALTQELTGKGFTFADWTMAAAPVALPVLALSALVLWHITPANSLDIKVAQERIRLRRLELGDIDLRGYAMGALLVITVLAWVLAGHASSMASIALLSVVAMFAMRLINWKALESNVNWGVVLMYGGAIAVGKALTVTGAGLWLAHLLFPVGLGGLALIACVALLTLVFTECVSNAAAVAIVLPVAIPVCIEAGLDPVTVALTIGIISGFAFMLPMGTPPNAMIFGTGYVKAASMLRYGSMISLSAFIIFMASAAWLWPLLGHRWS
ncbi:MAG: DASS family sodium-coupled anion symporter [Mariprofundus sp.]